MSSAFWILRSTCSIHRGRGRCVTKPMEDWNHPWATSREQERLPKTSRKVLPKYLPDCLSVHVVIINWIPLLGFCSVAQVFMPTAVSGIASGCHIQRMPYLAYLPALCCKEIDAQCYLHHSRVFKTSAQGWHVQHSFCGMPHYQKFTTFKVISTIQDFSKIFTT